jgi:hypothetical protein
MTEAWVACQACGEGRRDVTEHGLGPCPVCGEEGSDPRAPLPVTLVPRRERPLDEVLPGPWSGGERDAP